MTESEAAFIQSSMGTWYRRVKTAVWLCFGGAVLGFIALVTFVPACHFLHVPTATGCTVGGVNFDGVLTIFAFFNIALAIGVGATLGIIEQILILLFFATRTER